MYVTKRLAIGTCMGALGAAVLLSSHGNASIANPIRTAATEVQPAAFSYSDVFPWIVGSPTAGSAGAAEVATAVDGLAGAAAGRLHSTNALGPFGLTLNSIRAISADPGAPGSVRATTNYTNMDEWAAGMAGLVTSRGALGFVDNTERFDPLGANHAGVLQTANTFGPAFFDLNVLKAIGFFQAPSGTVLPTTGHPDNISAVDIGRWNAGIPGVITNSGTTGFVTYQDDGPAYRADHWVGGLHTTTKIGSQTFDFNFLPTVSVGVLPPSLSAGLAPDMTAAGTPFAPLSPPTPGIVQPGGGLPVSAPLPTAAPAPAPAPAPVTMAAADTSSGGPAPADPVEKSSTQLPAVRLNETPKAIIPGVNGAPLDRTSKSGTNSGGGNSSSFNPFKPITDAVKAGLGAFSGPKPTAGGESGSGAGGDSGSGSGSGDK